MRVLDAGCGTGELARAISRRFPNASVLGIDICAESLAEATSSCLKVENATFACADVHAIGEPDGSFDAIVCKQCLQYAQKREAVINEFSRLLRPLGTVHVCVWGEESKCEVIKFPIEMCNQTNGRAKEDQGRISCQKGLPTGPFCLADPAELERLLVGAGFIDVQIQTCQAEIAFPSFEEYWTWAARHSHLGEDDECDLRMAEAKAWLLRKLQKREQQPELVLGKGGETGEVGTEKQATGCSQQVRLAVECHIAVGTTVTGGTTAI